MFRKINQTGKVTFKQAIYDYFTGYFNLTGKTTRLGYFWVGVFYVLIFILLYIVTFILKTYLHIMSLPIPGVIFFIFILTLIPNITILARRLRDAGFNDVVITILIMLSFIFSKNLLISIIMLIAVLLPSHSTNKTEIIE